MAKGKSPLQEVADLLGIGGVVVLWEGDVWGPFDEREEALAWSYRHCKDGIFQLKILISPTLMD